MKRYVILLLLPASWALAQTTFQEQAERLQNINAYLLDFRPATAPIRFDSSTLELSFDLNVQPTVDARVGNKDEPLDPPSVVPKLRGRYVHRSGFYVGAALAPGIEFQDYEADYLSLELGYRFYLGGFEAGVRVHDSDGDVKGPITESGAEDLFTFSNRGADFSLGRTYGNFHFYAFGGYVTTDTELDIEADGVHLENDDSTYYGGAGATYDWRHWGVTFEQNFTDDYLANLILGLGYRF